MMPIYLTFILLSIHASVQADQDYGTLWARGAYADARALAFADHGGQQSLDERTLHPSFGRTQSGDHHQRRG